MNNAVKIALPRTEMIADEFTALFEQAVLGEDEKAIEAHKKLHDLRHEIDRNRSLLLGAHHVN